MIEISMTFFGRFDSFSILDHLKAVSLSDLYNCMQFDSRRPIISRVTAVASTKSHGGGLFFSSGNEIAESFFLQAARIPHLSGPVSRNEQALRNSWRGIGIATAESR
jgi:hypothetical protein